MKRVAIIGGGISGLTAAYELELARKRGAAIDWHLYEASDRLGGIIETTRIDTPEGKYILEGGPDGWISEKPWARELAIELGLEDELIYSNDDTRKTYILINGKLEAMPDGMRMMVPTDLTALDSSPIFSATARQAYRDELTRAEELKTSAPTQDESVASFVRRHFGDEVLEKVAAPLLSGVFGGDVHKLSVRAVMPTFVKMEQQHGSLILALQRQAETRGNKAPQPTFTSLRNGMASLVQAIVSQLPPERLHLNSPLKYIADSGADYEVIYGESNRAWSGWQIADHLISALPLDETRKKLWIEDDDLPSLLPVEASSAILAAFTWPSELVNTFDIPGGFGFLCPSSDDPEQLLACTFVDQKFPCRAPEGHRIVRAFFGSTATEALSGALDQPVAQVALKQLRNILGSIPDPVHTEIRRWPRSLPQYQVGHLDRMAQLEAHLSKTRNLHLLGNSYRGVGLPDLIRDARATAKRILE